MENKNEIVKELQKIEKENDNEFCLLNENKKNNKIEADNQINKITNTNQNNWPFIKTNSYSKLNGKLTISMNSKEKKELAEKYWIIIPEEKYDFYGKDIKNLYKNNKISNLKDIIGILMVFNHFLSNNEIKRFDKYFSILIRSYERNYITISNNSLFESNKGKVGKILYIGGNLNNNLGYMFQKEFSECDKQQLPVYISIMVFKEYEEIEISALDCCDKIPEHEGFSKFINVFHQNFSSKLSNKTTRIKNERNKKKEQLIKAQ